LLQLGGYLTPLRTTLSSSLLVLDHFLGGDSGITIFTLIPPTLSSKAEDFSTTLLTFSVPRFSSSFPDFFDAVRDFSLA